MSARIPQASWEQPNTSDKFGNVWRTKNINFDLDGYAQLSPRMVSLYNDSADGDFGVPLAIGRQEAGGFQVATSEANYTTAINTVVKTISENTGSPNPDITFNGDACWYQGLWHASTDTAVLSRPATGGGGQAWTSRITGLTSGKRHILRPFKSRVSICASNGHVVKQYDSSYSSTTDLTIPTDYEISGMAYNADKMGIITRLANDGTVGQDQEAQFFPWNGSTTGAVGYGLGSDAGIAIIPYLSSFVVLTRAGQLLYWNGGGFQVLESFPFYFSGNVYGDVQGNNALGAVFMETVGATILIHTGNEIQQFNRKGEDTLREFPSGVWCYKPKVRLHHKYSLSNSAIYHFAVASGDVSTNTLTISSGVVPRTGNIARLIDNSTIGGLTKNEDYYVIKVTDTTMRLAETREEALAGVAIDITSISGTSYFWVLNQKDYGTTRYTAPGAVRQIGDTGNNYAMYTDIIAGARLNDTDMTTVPSLCVAVPWLPNKGVIETPKFFSQQDKDTPQKIKIRFRPLNNDSSIVVYGRTRDVLGLPSSTSGDSATWTGANELYAEHDFSEAKAYIDAGGCILMEILAGVGAGEQAIVSSISNTGNTYAFQLKDDIFGVDSGDKCEFTLINYEKKKTFTSQDDVEQEVGADLKSTKFAQFLIELVGYDIIIEDILYVSGTHKVIS